MSKSKLLMYIIISILAFSVFLISSFNYIYSKEQKLLKNNYELLSSQIIKNIDFLIEDKKNATQSFAIALSKSDYIKIFLQTRNRDILNFEELSLELRKKQNLKMYGFKY